MSGLINHLWQSSLFAGGICLAALALRRNSARTRYWLWLAASIKFLLPFSLLVDLGSRMEKPAVVSTLPAATIEQVATTFTPVDAPPVTADWSGVLFAIWAIGAACIAVRWLLAWMKVRTAARRGMRLALDAPIPVLAVDTRVEPGVFGAFRPVLLLPRTLADALSAEEFRAVLDHELCHVKSRDNLTAVLHMLVSAAYWFHPLVWWIGGRLAEERERACDEAVVAAGNLPETYARGILNVCRMYVESPVACISGVTGADLKRRVEAIMLNRHSRRLTAARKLLLASAGVIAGLFPLALGALNGQPNAESLTFEVASIRPSDPNRQRQGKQIGIAPTPDGGMRAANMSLMLLIANAYEIPMSKDLDKYITGGPAWVKLDGFDIVAKARTGPADDPASASGRPAMSSKAIQEETRQRLRALLADRFKLVVREEVKEMPVFELVVAPGGHKLKESTRDDERGSVGGGRGKVVAENIRLWLLVANLRGWLGRPVIDKTGLTGRYDFTLEFSFESAGMPSDNSGDKPGAAASAGMEGPSLTTALREQLGLKVESARAPAKYIVIERAEKPSEN